MIPKDFIFDKFLLVQVLAWLCYLDDSYGFYWQ